MAAPSKASSKMLTPPGTRPVHPRHFTLSRRLLTLPVELIHQIFDDVSLSHILEILCVISPDTATITHLDECLLTHLRWFQVLFPPNPPCFSAAAPAKMRPRSIARQLPDTRWDASIHRVSRNGNQPSLGTYDYPPGGGPEVWSIKPGTLSLTMGKTGLDQEEAAYRARIGYLRELKKYFRVYLEIAHLAYRDRLNEIIDELGLGELGECIAKSINGELILVSIKNTIIYRRLAESQFQFFLPAYRQFTLKGLASREEKEGQPQKKKIRIEHEDMKYQEEFPLPAGEGQWDFLHLKEQWTTLRSAERRLMLTKASQLRRLASLIERYPGMLRFGKNPSQNRHTRSREIHTIQRLLRDAERLKLDGRTEMWHSMVAAYVFKRQAFPLVPFDRILWGMVMVLERFPLNKAENYPDEIAEKLRMVTERMNYYTIHPPTQHTIGKQAMGEPPERLIRTLHTPFSAAEKRTGDGLMQPVFLGCEVEEQKRLVRNWEMNTDYVNYVRYVLPLREEEFDWLEAFMECVEWFGKWEGRPWKEAGGITVAQWWRRRVLE